MIAEPITSVFPDPVAEPAITSFPEITKGIALVCISLGFSNLSSSITFNIASNMPNFLNSIIFYLVKLKKKTN